MPSAERLVQYLRSQGQANEFSTAPLVHQMEVSILTMLNWSLTVVSPLHFLGLFHRRGLVFTTDTMGFEPLVPKVVEYLRKYSDFYSDLCLQEYSFQQCVPCAATPPTTPTQPPSQLTPRLPLTGTPLRCSPRPSSWRRARP